MRCTTSGAGSGSGRTWSVPPTNMAASEAEADLYEAEANLAPGQTWVGWYNHGEYISPLTGVVPCCSLKNWDDPPSEALNFWWYCWCRWWLNQPTWKNIVVVKLDHFHRGEHQKYLKPPPSDTVDDSEIWRENQLRLVIDPNIYKVLYIQTVVVLGSEASTVPSSSLALKHWLKDNEDEYLDVPGS